MLSLYKETLVGLDQLNGATTITYEISASSSKASSSQVTSQTTTVKSETAFASKCLASEGSIYFRQAQSYPRSFLWRVVDEKHTLEIRCADLVKSRREQSDVNRVLRIKFPSAIAPKGVAFSNAEGQDHIHCFVITEGRELYTFHLQSAIFSGRLDVINGIFRKSAPSYFSLSRPFKLYAHNPYEVFVSFENGALQRLTRKAEDDG